MAREAAARARAFCERFGLRLPILLAPMAGACPASLSIAVGQRRRHGRDGGARQHARTRSGAGRPTSAPGRPDRFS